MFEYVVTGTGSVIYVKVAEVHSLLTVIFKGTNATFVDKSTLTAFILYYSSVEG